MQPWRIGLGNSEVCGLVQAALDDGWTCQVPTLNCGTLVLPGCTKQWLPVHADLSGGQRQPSPRSSLCPPFIKNLPDGSDSAIRATAEPMQFLIHSLITPCLIESQWLQLNWKELLHFEVWAGGGGGKGYAFSIGREWGDVRLALGERLFVPQVARWQVSTVCLLWLVMRTCQMLFLTVEIKRFCISSQ